MAKIQIYIRDIQSFNKIYNSIRALWYSRYGISLSKGDVVLKSLILLETELLGDTKNKNDNKGQNIYKYKRIGL